MTRTYVSFLLGLVFLLVLLAERPAGASQVVLFDQGHGQKFLTGQQGPLDLSCFAELFTEQGATVKTTARPLTDMVLGDIDILVLSGPFAPVSRSETKAIVRFLHQGGKLAVMAHIAQPLGTLLSTFGVRISSSPVGEQANLLGSNPLDYTLLNLEDHPLTVNLAGINVYGGWALLPDQNHFTPLATTSALAWLDINRNNRRDARDPVQAFHLILAGKVRKGDVVIFGDDAIFQNKFIKGDNHALAVNLVKWFMRPGTEI